MNDNNQSNKIYDLIIIGGSAAATVAGIYAARRGLNFKLITKDFGGEVATSGEIGNWPGVIQTDGITLSGQFKDHLKHYKVDITEGVEVTRVSKQEDGFFCITSASGQESSMAVGRVEHKIHDIPKCDYVAKTVIVTTGVHPRELGITGEKEFRNKGVSYCTTCDGPLFPDKTLATIGGGNSALESALMLAEIGKKVYVLNKNDEFKGEKVLIDKLMANDKVEIIYNADTKEITGDQFVNGLKYKDKDGKEQSIDVEGIFVHIGMVPNSAMMCEQCFLPEGVELDKFKQIVVNQVGETNIPGLYAAGDVTNIPFNQIVIAAGMGCTALLSAVSYLNKLDS